MAVDAPFELKKESGNLSQDAIFRIFTGFYDAGLTHEIKRLLHVYDIDIDTRNWNNDNCLIWSCAKHGDLDGVKFCVENGSSEGMEYAAALAMRNDYQVAIDIIDYLIENGSNTWAVFHRSLTWDHIDINRHLMKKWRNKIDVTDWTRCAIDYCNDKVIKYLCSTEPFCSLITDEDLKKTIHWAIYKDSTCTASDYLLIEFLVKEKGIRLSDEDVMAKIYKLLEHYDPEKLGKSGFEYFEEHPELYQGLDLENDFDEVYKLEQEWESKNHLYMPNLFKNKEGTKQ